MHIYLKNKKLLFGNYKAKCSLGKRGITSKKKEGDMFTPKGKFKLNYVLYRKDRIRIKYCQLKKVVIKKNMGWCDDPKSKKYNKLIKFPFYESAEKLYLKKNVYDILIVLNYNMRPTVPGKGSAIFLHLANKKYSPTKGCIAISKKNMVKLLKEIKPNYKIVIN